MTTISEIVPQGVMVRIADRVARSARQFARQTGSTRIPKAIKVGHVHATQQTASISILLDTDIAPQAMIFEKGATEHPIDAKNAPYLVFEGTHDHQGHLVKVEHVDHPGMKARPFIKPAKESTHERNMADLREAVGKNFRLQIRTYKV